MSKITNPTTEASITCGFFNSMVVDGVSDRRYNAEQMSAIFDGLINDGVFASIGDALVVSASSGNIVNVGTGKCWFNHTWTRNDAVLPVDCGAPPTNLNFKRIDAIVVEVNASDDKRDNFIKVIRGVETSNPDKPTLIKSALVNQHALCYITRRPGASITAADIENVVGTSETPFVTGIVQVTSLDALLGQWTAQLNNFMAARQADVDSFISIEEADFNAWYTDMKQLMQDVAVELNDWTVAEKTAIMTWFDDIKGKLQEDLAVNLQLQINADEVERFLTEGLPDGIKTISEDGTVIKTVDSKNRILTKTFTDNFSTITSVLVDNSGKNHLPYPYPVFGGEKTKTIDNVTFTDNGDGTITVNGTPRASARLILASDLALPKGIYSLSGCPIGGSENTYYFGINVYNNTSPITKVHDHGYGATLDTTQLTYTKCKVFIDIMSNVTVNNITFNPKVMTYTTELGRLVKKISSDGKTIESTLTNNAEKLPNLVEIERGIDTIIASENKYIEG